MQVLGLEGLEARGVVVVVWVLRGLLLDVLLQLLEEGLRGLALEDPHLLPSRQDIGSL